MLLLLRLLTIGLIAGQAAAVGLSSATVRAGLYKPDSPVISLGPDKLAVVQKDSQHTTLVEYYSAWCGHCQHFAPTYEKFAVAAQEAYPSLQVVAIDCAQYEVACREAKINRFPTIRLYPGEIPCADRDVPAMLAFIGAKAPHTVTRGAGAVEGTSAAAAAAAAAMAAAAAGADSVGGGSALSAGAMATQGEAGELVKEPDQGLLPEAITDDGQVLLPRPQLLMVPAADVLAAAKYSLYHEVLLPGDTRRRFDGSDEAERFTALQVWVQALERGLPRTFDGGVAVAGVKELHLALRGMQMKLPTRQRWMEMLEHSGVDHWPSDWVMCNSMRPELHAYPCGLWLLFHTLLAHSTQMHAMQTLYAIVRYVDVFFSCEDCAGHFRNMSKALHDDLGLMKKIQDPRSRTELWLWQAHNRVNARLAQDERHSQFAEYLKEQWPSRSACAECHDMVEVPMRGPAKRPPKLVEKGWRQPQILRYLHHAYCLEPHFECWDVGEDKLWQHGEARSKLGLAVTAAAVACLLLLACGCGRTRKPKKADHLT